MTAATDYALGYQDGSNFRGTQAREDTAAAIELIENDLKHGMQGDLRPYWIGYLAALEGRPPLFTETQKD